MTNDKHDKALKDMSKYLLQGAEMLKDSCPICDVPLLKLKGKIFCGGCNKEVFYATEETALELEHKFTYENESKSIFRNTETILLGKLENVINNIPNDQKEELLSSLDIIDKILSLLLRLKGF